MKKLFTLLYIIFIGHFLSIGQNTSIDFLNWHIKKYNFSKIIHVNTNLWTNEDINLLSNENSPYFEEINNLLSFNDVNEFKKIVSTYNEHISWKKDILKTLDIKAVKTKIQKMDNEAAYWSYSEPILLQNNSLCIMKIDFICGKTCRTSNIMIFEKTGNTWNKLMELTPIQQELLSSF